MKNVKLDEDEMERIEKEMKELYDAICTILSNRGTLSNLNVHVVYGPCGPSHMTLNTEWDFDYTVSLSNNQQIDIEELAKSREELRKLREIGIKPSGYRPAPIGAGNPMKIVSDPELDLKE